MDERGKVCVNCAFNERDNSDVKRILDYIAGGMKKSADLAETDAETENAGETENNETEA